MHLAWVFFDSAIEHVLRAIFTFTLVAVHLDGVLFTCALAVPSVFTSDAIAVHSAWVFFNFGQGIVYVWLGWLTFG